MIVRCLSPRPTLSHHPPRSPRFLVPLRPGLLPLSSRSGSCHTPLSPIGSWPATLPLPFFATRCRAIARACCRSSPRCRASTLDVRPRCAMAALLHHDANPPRPVASRIASPQPLYSRQSIPCSGSRAYPVFNACTLGTFHSVSAPNIRQVCQCPFPTLSPVRPASCIMKLSANWRPIFLFDPPHHHTV